jgi:hypothetical protein
LKQICLLFRNVIVNYFPRLIKDESMCHVANECMYPNSSLLRNLQDSSTSNMMHSVRTSSDME